jgi:hypothetical protein
MKPLNVLALIIGAIALLPSASFADNVISNTQEVNQESTVFGHNNIVSSDARQSIVNLQKSGRHEPNVSGTQRINAKTTIIGNDNTDLKSAAQATINGQKSK